MQSRLTHTINLALLLLALFLFYLVGCSSHPQPVDAPQIAAAPRLLILTAIPSEREKLLRAATLTGSYLVNGRTFTSAQLGGHDVIIASSGVSMVNAAMNAQTALDHFNITAVLFSGIAGGVNPALHIGDVVVPAQWGQYQEQVFARQVDGGWDSGWHSQEFGNYGMMFPQPLTVSRPGGNPDEEEELFWFPVDPFMLDTATRVSGSISLRRCIAAVFCLADAPRVVVGGNGVSGPTFVDNSAYRQWVWETFRADALDMESAAVAQVAYVNQVPFLALRSLSDLAGGGGGETELLTFSQLAADNSAALVVEFLKAWP
jgi:adenosylhomocysteine nucleosidase